MLESTGDGRFLNRLTAYRLTQNMYVSICGYTMYVCMSECTVPLLSTVLETFIFSFSFEGEFDNSEIHTLLLRIGF